MCKFELITRKKNCDKAIAQVPYKYSENAAAASRIATAIDNITDTDLFLSSSLQSAPQRENKQISTNAMSSYWGQNDREGGESSQGAFSVEKWV